MKRTKIADKLYEISSENWHIHSNISKCAHAEMTPANIIAIAEEFQLEKIAIVDHHHPGENGLVEKTLMLKNEIAQIQSPVSVIAGAELSAFGPGKYADDLETNRLVGFRLYACNHYHIRNWTHPALKTPEGYIRHSLDTATSLILSGRADCIAHPLLGAYIETYKKKPSLLTSAFSDNDLSELFELSNAHNVTWELSIGKLLCDIPFAKRFIKLGIQSGASFRMGTDAHRLYQINPKPQVLQLIKEMEKI